MKTNKGSRGRPVLSPALPACLYLLEDPGGEGGYPGVDSREGRLSTALAPAHDPQQAGLTGRATSEWAEVKSGLTHVYNTEITCVIVCRGGWLVVI